VAGTYGEIVAKENPLAVAYNAILAAKFSLSTANIFRAMDILDAALQKLNSEHTKEVQKVFGIGK
jgi:hypothetical protein